MNNIMAEKELKLSKWTIIVPLNEKFFVAYHTLSGGIILLDKEAKEFLDKIKEQGVLIEDIKDPKTKKGTPELN